MGAGPSGAQGQTGKTGTAGAQGPPGAVGPGNELSLPPCLVSAGPTQSYHCRGNTFEDAQATARWAQQACVLTGGRDPGCFAPPGDYNRFGITGLTYLDPGAIKPVGLGACGQLYFDVGGNATTTGNCMYVNSPENKTSTCAGTAFCPAGSNQCTLTQANICETPWTTAKV